MKTASFERFGGLCGILAGLGGPLYSLAFVLLVVFGRNPPLGLLISSFLLTVGGLLTLVLMVALYYRLRGTDAAAALLALALSLAGLLGSALHGGYDLANQIHAPDPSLPDLSGLPSPVDPRGLATFGLVGAALLLFSWLMGRSGQYTKALVNLGTTSGTLMVVLYLGRLILLNPRNPLVLLVAALTGLIVNPAFYISVGLKLRRAPVEPSTEEAAAQPRTRRSKGRGGRRA